MNEIKKLGLPPFFHGEKSLFLIFFKGIKEFLISFLFVFIIIYQFSANSQDFDKSKLIPSRSDKFLYEIGEIRFEGNKNFSEDELLGAVSTRPTERSVTHKVLLHISDQINVNPKTKKYIPASFLSSFKSTLKSMSSEVRYFDQFRVENDLLSLAEYYNQNGFHNAIIKYSLKPNNKSKSNILIFHIIENESSFLNTISLLGLDSLSIDVLDKIQKIRSPKLDIRFNEEEILIYVRAIRRRLLDNGYYYAFYEIPTVTKDTANKTDSVTIIFHPGLRQRIENVQFIDSTRGQNPVASGMKYDQLEIKPGDWYSISKVEQTRNNFLSLGTYDVVSIDTTSAFTPKTDTSLPFLVFTQYRKQQEWGFSGYVNRTAIENKDNLGIELSYFNRNIGGMAQSANIYSRVELQDLSRAFTHSRKEFEFQIGLNFAQPYWFSYDKARFGASGQLLFSITKINTDIQLKTFSIPIKLPITLPQWTYLQAGSAELYIEWQAPSYIKIAKENAIKNAATDEEKKRVEESFKIYEALDKYSANTIAPTSLLWGFSFIGNTRDNPFAPTKGYYFNLSGDGWLGSGISKFYRLQATYYLFQSLNKFAVFALKARGGALFWVDRQDSYVPLERQFFSGGANSIRGWQSRRLRYPQPDSSTIDFFLDYIGNAAIIEGSFEFRYQLPRYGNIGGTLADWLQQLVLTSFIDYGNSFHWLANDSYKYKWYEYITKLAVAGGVGVGFLTPVGPIRVDFALPIYDPSNKENKTIFTKVAALKSVQFNIGLGFAF